MYLKVTGLQEVQQALKKELGKLRTPYYTLVGIHESAGMTDDGQMTVAKLGAIQHFGADINHPGGTRYVIGKDGKARFVSDDFVGPVSGVTGPHKITIPARPWLDVGAEAGAKEMLDTIQEGVEDGLNAKQIITRVGLTAEGAIKKYINELNTPPNAASTIRKKGSSNPLVDTGNMRESVVSTVVGKKPQEGLE
jgi:phage gpG-like protein